MVLIAIIRLILKKTVHSIIATAVFLPLLYACSQPPPTVEDVPGSEPTLVTNPTATQEVVQRRAFEFQPANPVLLYLKTQDDQAVSQFITPDGGSLSAELGDGTRFTLDIPAKALLSDEVITLVPVMEVSGMPAGQFMTGVRLEPEGLRLLEPAILTIQHKRALPLDEEAGFLASGSSNELVLYPLLPGSHKASFLVFEFDEFLIAQLSTGAREELLAYPPSGDFNQFLHSIAGLVSGLRSQRLSSIGSIGKLARISLTVVAEEESNEDMLKLVKMAADYREEIRMKIFQAKQSTDRDFIQSVLHEVLAFERHQQLLGISADDETVFPEAVGLFEHLIDVILNQIEQRCEKYFDLDAYRELLGISRTMQLLGITNENESRIDRLLERCLDLTLEFESMIENSPFVELGHSYQFSVRAVIPLSFNYELMGWEGRGPIEWVDAQASPYEGVGGDGGNIICQTAVIENMQSSTAEVLKMTINFNDKPQPPQILMLFVPGTPTLHIYHDCSNLPASAKHWTGPTREYDFRYWSDLFLENYGYLTFDEMLVEGFAHIYDWQILDKEHLFAIKEVLVEDQENLGFAGINVTMRKTEKSLFKLNH